MLSLFAPETVELVHFDGHNLTFRSRRPRRQGPHKVRLLLAVADRLEKLDLPVCVKSARQVPGGTECTGPVELPGEAVRTLASFLQSAVDRRRSERFPARVHVRGFRLPGGSAETVDISEHGMQLAVKGPLAPGTTLDLTLISKGLISVQGRVVWASGQRVGVEITCPATA